MESTNNNQAGSRLPGANVLPHLDPDHQAKVDGSGLTVQTVRLAGLYSEHDTDRLRHLLNGARADAPALMFPYFDLSGYPIDYIVARPSVPRPSERGRVRKYVMPYNMSNRAYFPPLPAAIQAVNTPGEMLLITEGILKALAATQAGVPCIGLMGVWNWQVAQSRPRRLIDDLQAIDWRGRIVAVVFDFDSTRNPSVRYGEAEIARVLSEQGAHVHILQLPPGPRDPLTGRPQKQAVDDYIVRYGEDAFRRWIDNQLARQPERSLDEWRQEMADSRIATLGRPGRYLDRSPCGSGKSYSDCIALSRHEAGRSLFLQPTHASCAEVEEELQRQGISAVSYPKLDLQTCSRFPEALDIQQQGLVFQAILCPACPHAPACPYRIAYSRARTAQHAIATHKRGEIRMADLTLDRDYVTIHENPLAMLRPTYSVATGLDLIEVIAQRAGLDCHDRYGRRYYRRMQVIARELAGRLREGDGTTMIPMPAPATARPRNANRDLYRAIQNLGVRPVGKAMQLVRAAADGRLDVLWRRVDHPRRHGGVPRPVRSLVGVLAVELPAHAVIWLNDATARECDLVSALGYPIEDRTPAGVLARQHPLLQIPEDVTRRTSIRKAADILRGLLHDLPYRRVGVVTHKTLCTAGLREAVAGEYANRIAMLEHFGGGRSRGSNAWTASCDALIILGTPRVSPSAIREELIRLGCVTAAGITEEQAGWGHDYWSGITESGRRTTVRTLHYMDHDWHGAYVGLVVAELKQVIGRGRTILEQGIPTYLVTTEELGATLVDGLFAPLTAVQIAVLSALYDDRGNPRVQSSSQVARAVGCSRQHAYTVLTHLESARRVERVGIRGGWRPL